MVSYDKKRPGLLLETTQPQHSWETKQARYLFIHYVKKIIAKQICHNEEKGQAAHPNRETDMHSAPFLKPDMHINAGASFSVPHRNFLVEMPRLQAKNRICPGVLYV